MHAWEQSQILREYKTCNIKISYERLSSKLYDNFILRQKILVLALSLWR